MKPLSRVRIGAVAVLLAAASAGVSAQETRPTFEPAFAVAAFAHPRANPFFPLVPGTTFVHEGETADGFEHDEFTVTKKTKKIVGVVCLVVHDRAWVDGELAEDTFDYLAPDDQGNVWYFGEDTRELEDGVVVSTEGSWLAGVDGAVPGVLVPGSPQAGMSYRQELAEGVAEDMARVLRVDGRASVPYGDFDGCLVTKEWTPLSPGSVEYKTYAPGVGLVLVEEPTGGMTARIELVAIVVR
jgi:hypothetical protein